MQKHLKRAAGRIARKDVFLGIAATVAVVRSPARAADFTWRVAHNMTTSHPVGKCADDLAAAVQKETNGRLVLQMFPNHTLGSNAGSLQQVRLGAVQMYGNLGATYSEMLPIAGVDGVGFAFANNERAAATMDGPLGAYIQGEFEKKGLHAMRTVWDEGMRHVTSFPKPIVTLADYNGFKIRVPEAKIAIDLFRTLGAAPAAIDGSETYTSLQTHIVDGAEQPLDALESQKIYEVQKYVSLTSHSWTSHWWTVNLAMWKSLPGDLQAVLERNFTKYGLIERKMLVEADAASRQRLQARGIQFSQVDTAPLRAKLRAYYGRWRANFGNSTWAMLEETTGKLA